MNMIYNNLDNQINTLFCELSIAINVRCLYKLKKKIDEQFGMILFTFLNSFLNEQITFKFQFTEHKVINSFSDKKVMDIA